MPNQITAWSFSRYQTYKECPARAKYKFIDKLPEPFSGPAAERGTAIHKLAEDFANKTIKVLPPELKLFKEQFEELRKSKPLLEQEWAFTKSWGPTGWFGADTWLRVKVDAACKDGDTLYVIDHKTGKKKEDHPEQLSLYAIAGVIRVPGIVRVSTQLWYLDHGGDPVEHVFEAAEIPALQKEWEKKIKPMFTETRFSPRPGNYCRWCHFRKENGGPCKF